MSNELPRPQQSEEVDLGQLFKLIGNMFERLFRFIGSIFNKLFLVFVWLVFFIKKHFLKFVIAGVLGILLGFILEKTSGPVYKSYITVKQNYKTGEDLYNSIDYYNDLINQGDNQTLANVIEIDTASANSILAFEIESVISENDRVKSFDRYTKELDSVLASTIEYKTYVNNLEEYNHSLQQITIKSKGRNNFKSVFERIVEKINKNKYFQNEQRKDTLELQNRKIALLGALVVSDSLKKTYKRVLETLPIAEGSQTSVTIKSSDDVNKTREFELYQNDLEIKRELVEIEREKEDKMLILEIVSSKQDSGSRDNRKEIFDISLSAKLYYGLLFVILTFIILAGIQFITFLERFKNKIQK